MLIFLFKSFLTLFVVIDPVGLAPVFVSLASFHTDQEQIQIAGQAVLVAAVILIGFALGGDALLRFLGISIQAFQVAGGFLLFRIAVDMVFAQWQRETEEERVESQQRQDISVFPLAIPLIAGPGTLVSTLILTSEAQDYPLGMEIVLGNIVVVLLISYVLLRLAVMLAKILGQTGINVITRILGILVAALAVQYIAEGSGALLEVALNRVQFHALLP